MNNQNKISVSAVPFNPQTQTFNPSMGTVNVGGSLQNSAPAGATSAPINAPTTMPKVQTGVPTAEQNLAAFQATQPKYNNPNPTIATDSFNTPKLNIPFAQISTFTTPTQNLAADGMQRMATPVSDATQNISKLMLDILPNLQGQSAELANQQKARNIEGLQTNLQNISNQILQKQAELNQDDVRLVAGIQGIEKQAIPMQFITGQQQSVQRDAQIARALKSSEIGVLNASALAAQGNITLAEEQAQRAVEAKYAPFIETYNLLQKQLTAIQPLLNAEEKKVAAEQAVYADVQKQLINYKIDQQKNISSLLMQAQANGVDAQTYSKAINAFNSGKSDLEIAGIIGAYGGKEYLANKEVLDMTRNYTYNAVGDLTTDNGYDLEAFKRGIASTESSNNYNAIGPATSTGDKAYGKYQVMGANIPSWTKAAGLGSMTPQQFLKSPEAQERVFENQSLTNYAKYGNWDDVASVWFSGQPLSNNNRSDGYNTVPQYVAKVRKAMGVPAQPTTFSQVTNPSVAIWGKFLQTNGNDKDALSKVPKNLQTAALAWTNQNVENTPAIEALNSKILQIDNIINSSALSAVVGPNIAARGLPSVGSVFTKTLAGAGVGAAAGAPFAGIGAIPGALGGAALGFGTSAAQAIPYFSGAAQNFIGDVDQLSSKEFIDNLINVKGQGATFGALTEKEGMALRDAATKLNNWKIADSSGKTIGYNIDEASFVTELNRIKELAQKGIAYKGGNILGGTVTDSYFNNVIPQIAGSTNQSTIIGGYK